MKSSREEKSKPRIRIKPIMHGGFGLFTRDIDLYVENIGTTPAKDVVIVCRSSPFNLCLEVNKGVHKIPLLLPKERPVELNIIMNEMADFLCDCVKNLYVEVTYSTSEGKKLTPRRITYTIAEIEFTSEGG